MSSPSCHSLRLLQEEGPTLWDRFSRLVGRARGDQTDHDLYSGPRRKACASLLGGAGRDRRLKTIADRPYGRHGARNGRPNQIKPRVDGLRARKIKSMRFIIPGKG